MTSALGTATMTCGHQFHLGCVARWLLKTESCPLCRREATEKEKIAEDQSEDSCSEDYDDDESSVNSEDGDWVRVATGRWILRSERDSLEIPDYDHEKHAFWVLRRTFELLEAGVDIAATGVEPVRTYNPAECLSDRNRWRYDPGEQYVHWRHRQTDPRNEDDRGYESA